MFTKDLLLSLAQSIVPDGGKIKIEPVKLIQLLSINRVTAFEDERCITDEIILIEAEQGFTIEVTYPADCKNGGCIYTQLSDY